MEGHSKALEYQIGGIGSRPRDDPYEFATAFAWMAIHSWSPFANYEGARGRELNEQERNIVKVCDYDFKMMYIASALAGVHLDLSEIAYKTKAP
jgi:hypothetical protein